MALGNGQMLCVTAPLFPFMFTFTLLLPSKKCQGESVAEGARGQGIGYALVQAAFAALVSLSPDGYLLWYNPGNPLAEQFWPHLGFAPLWTTYQRLHQE